MSNSIIDHQSNPPLRFSWRLFWILFGVAVFGILASVPMEIDLFRPVLSNAPLPFPLPLIILLGAVQNLAFVALFVGAGLWLSSKLGLGCPLIQSWLNNDLRSDRVRDVIRVGLSAGVILGAVLLPLIWFLARNYPALPFVTAGRISLWKRFLICFYGGFFEEIFTRLFLLSLVAWLFSKGWRGGSLRAVGFWLSNALVAVIFGLGHLPAVSLLMPITSELVAAALILNGLAALLFGWLYKVKGLETAMVAHFTTDAMLYVIGPLFL